MRKNEQNASSWRVAVKASKAKLGSVSDGTVAPPVHGGAASVTSKLENVLNRDFGSS